MENKPEWMPENPCGECQLKPRDELCYGCFPWEMYETKLAVQTKLLEYLIKEHIIGKTDNAIQQMLKELNNGK